MVQLGEVSSDHGESILFVMDYIDENENILKNIYHSLGRDELSRFFHADFIDVCRSTIEKAAQMENITVSQDFKDFLSRFYTGAIADILLEWIVNKSIQDKEKNIQYISLILRSSIINALNAAQEKGFIQ